MPQPDHISNARRKLAPPRVVRTERSHVEEGDAHLWAVSYSDLLMVLMSFFVIYFSFDDASSAKTGILNIAKSMKGDVVAGSATDGGTMKNTGTGSGTGFVNGTNDSFKKRLESLNVKVETPGSALMLNLESDIFPLGQFELNGDTQARLKEVLDIVKPYKDEVEIVIIGHSDSARMGKKNTYLSNNFDLSSLRALKALQFLLEQGFPSDRISAQGAGENARNSRSLSLKIQLRGKPT